MSFSAANKMRIETWLQSATDTLSVANVDTARLDALVLLSDALGKDKAMILAHPEIELDDQQRAKLDNLLSRRTAHEPLAYIRNKTEFYGREFKIGSGVLVPRPESEAIIDLLLEAVHAPDGSILPAPDGKSWKIGDVGAGSGALGITASIELPGSDVELLEIDTAALEIAQMNVIFHTTGCRVTHSDLLRNTRQNFDILLCNLPYVPDEFTINEAARHEPSIAIFGGPDGLDVFRHLFQQINSLQTKPLYILTEALPVSHRTLSKIAAESGYSLQKTTDFAQLFSR